MTDQVTETVFTETNAAQTPVAEITPLETKEVITSPEIENYADLLKEITREDGTQKYANIPDVIKATKASQDYIKQLEAEALVHKAEIAKRMAAEDVLEQIKANKTSEVTPSKELDLSQIDALLESKISSTLSAAEAQKVKRSNVDSVITAMTKKFGTGDAAEEHFIETAKSTGFTIAQLNELSATNPKAVLKLAGLDGEPQVSPASTTGSINTSALKPNETTPSLKMPNGATGKDMANIWRAAGTPST